MVIVGETVFEGDNVGVWVPEAEGVAERVPVGDHIIDELESTQDDGVGDIDVVADEADKFAELLHIWEYFDLSGDVGLTADVDESDEVRVTDVEDLEVLLCADDDNVAEAEVVADEGGDTDEDGEAVENRYLLVGPQASGFRWGRRDGGGRLAAWWRGFGRRLPRGRRVI